MFESIVEICNDSALTGVTGLALIFDLDIFFEQSATQNNHFLCY